MSIESEFKDVIREVVLDIMKDFDLRIKALAINAGKMNANYIALVSLLDERGIVTTDEFDKRQAEIMKEMNKEFDDLMKHKVEDGLQ